MKAVCTKIKDREFYPELDKIGVWYGDAEHRIWQTLYVEKGVLKDVKRKEVLNNMTGRQFNSIRIDLDGKKKGLIEILDQREDDMLVKIEGLQAKIVKEEKKFGVPNKAKKARFKVHQWKRSLQRQTSKLLEVQAELDANIPALCFGSRELFYQQFNWAQHGFASFAEWQQTWKEARSNHFYSVGCGKSLTQEAETGGNQSCTLTLVSYNHEERQLEGTLRLRLPKCQETKDNKYLFFPVKFGHNSQHLYNALVTGQAITYQWLRRKNHWYVHALVEEWNVPIITNRKNGGLGIDYNPLFLSLGFIKHDGNPLWAKDLEHHLEGKSSEEREAIIAELVKQAVLEAYRNQVPVVIEALDFEAKKREWKNAGYNRMLSSFAYHQFHALTLAIAASLGVEVITINPRNTTTIGIVKFQGYGFSKDQAAAIAIVRRGLKFSERVRGRLFSALPLPAAKQSAGDKGRHVTPSWPQLRRGLKLTRNGWQFKGVSVKVKAKADDPKGCRASKQGRGENPPSSTKSATIGLAGPPSSDSAGQRSRGNESSLKAHDLVSVGPRGPTPGDNAVRSPRSTRRKSDIGFCPQG